ncbi:MAG: SWIM zinc finger family protein [Gemmataceae bacterium]
MCDCKGFEHRGMQTKDGKGCRHVAALTVLRQRNLI